MNGINSIWKTFLRPPRQIYNDYDLGPVVFETNQSLCKRDDFEIVNQRLLHLQCSIYYPFSQKLLVPETCVVYLHSFNGSRLESIKYAGHVTSQNFAFCHFDFSGQGLSEGELVTLGYHEQDDVHQVVQYLLQQRKFPSIILWGRSLGATTALLYSIRQPDKRIKAIIADSPFRDLQKQSIVLIQKKTNAPKWIAKGMLKFVRHDIEKHGEMKMEEVRLPQSINLSQPLLLLASSTDDVVPYKNTKKIFANYSGQKQFIPLDCSHNETRSESIMFQVLSWVQNVLRNEKMQQKQLEQQFFQEERYSVKQVSSGSRIKDKIINQSQPQPQPQLQLQLQPENRRSSFAPIQQSQQVSESGRLASSEKKTGTQVGNKCLMSSVIQLKKQINSDLKGTKLG